MIMLATIPRLLEYQWVLFDFEYCGAGSLLVERGQLCAQVAKADGLEGARLLNPRQLVFRRSKQVTDFAKAIRPIEPNKLHLI